MAQMVARLDDDLAAAVDGLVDAGVVASRSDAIRIGLERLVDEHRRRMTGDAIVEGYRRRPQSERDVGWSDTSTVAMIADDPW